MAKGFNAALGYCQLWSLALLLAREFHLYLHFMALILALGGGLIILWNVTLPGLAQPIARITALALGFLALLGLVIGRLSA